MQERFEFRKHPIPYTGKHRRSRWLRHIHTVQEKRYSCDPELQRFYRRRRGMNLPSSWDDFVCSDYLDDSWKNSTKDHHQWEHRVRFTGRCSYVYKESNERFVEEENLQDST